MRRLSACAPRWRHPAAAIVRRVADTVDAWAALAVGDQAHAVEAMRQAADPEDRLGKSPVTPGHVLPARELLGDMLLQLGRRDEAHAATQALLALSPHRHRSLEGLASTQTG